MSLEKDPEFLGLNPVFWEGREEAEMYQEAADLLFTHPEFRNKKTEIVVDEMTLEAFHDYCQKRAGGEKFIISNTLAEEEEIFRQYWQQLEESRQEA
ncbi:MAG: hypothetical protein WCW26_00725 [Candidatus Buchananbacteria bacterium]